MDTGTLQLEVDVHLVSLEFGTNLDFLFIVGKKLEKKIFLQYFLSQILKCLTGSRSPRLTTVRGWKALPKYKQMNKQANNRHKTK